MIGGKESKPTEVRQMRGKCCLLVITLLGGLWATALADGGEAIGIGSTKIITVAPVQGMTLSQRARELQARLVEVLTVLRAGQDPEVRVEVGEAGPMIFVKGIRFITVTHADGRLHKSRPLDLAHVWAERLENVLPAIAPLNVPDDVLTPALERPQLSIEQDLTFAPVQAWERRFNITVTARGGEGERYIQVTKRDTDGLAIVLGERLDPSKARSVAVVTRGSVVFEVFQDGAMVHREHLPLPRRR